MMIDWQTVALSDFSLEVEAEGIQDLGSTLVFPLKVYFKKEQLAFVHPVSIRSEFYSSLMKLPDARAQLFKIFNSRLRDELVRRKQQSAMTVRDKIDLMTSPHPLTD